MAIKPSISCIAAIVPFFMGASVVELCLHIANVLYLMSFLGRDMLHLRVLTCAGLVLGILFFSCQPTPLYGPTAWHVVFLVINIAQIVILLGERRALMLTQRQAQVADAAFHDLSREDLVTLLTRVMYRNPRTLPDIPRACHESLTPEERALHDIAFRRLTRQEAMILLTRKLWNVLKRLNPRRWQAARGAEQPLARIAR